MQPSRVTFAFKVLKNFSLFSLTHRHTGKRGKKENSKRLKKACSDARGGEGPHTYRGGGGTLTAAVKH
jgi:hypothetical protein